MAAFLSRLPPSRTEVQSFDVHPIPSESLSRISQKIEELSFGHVTISNQH